MGLLPNLQISLKHQHRMTGEYGSYFHLLLSENQITSIANGSDKLPLCSMWPAVSSIVPT